MKYKYYLYNGYMIYETLGPNGVPLFAKNLPELKAKWDLAHRAYFSGVEHYDPAFIDKDLILRTNTIDELVNTLSPVPDNAKGDWDMLF